MTGKRLSGLSIAYKALALDRDLTLIQRRTCGNILAHFNTKTGQCDPSVERLVALSGIGRKEVLAATAFLSNDGWFVKLSHGGKSHRASYSPIWAKFASVVSAWEKRAAAGSSPDGDGGSETSLSKVGENPSLMVGENPSLMVGEYPTQTLRSNSLKELPEREPTDRGVRIDRKDERRKREDKPEAQRSMIYAIRGGRQPSHADAAEAAQQRRVASEIAALPTLDDRIAAHLKLMGEKP
jgi:hypothetical protein